MTFHASYDLQNVYFRHYAFCFTDFVCCLFSTAVTINIEQRNPTEKCN